MGKRLTLEYVGQYFKDEGCILLEEEYVNNHTKMKYICNCGNVSEISFNHFQLGSRCNKCGNKKIKEKLKFTLEYVRQCFEDGGCILMEEEYINCMTLMRYECICGNISKISFSNLKKGQRCNKCGIKKRSKKRKFTLEFVKQCFEDGGCILLEEEYKGANTKMKYRCECGDINEISFSDFKQGKRCMKCGVKKTAKKQKFTFEYVYNCFKEEGCELLETEYKGANILMKYRCSCGNVREICFGRFRQGGRCWKCGVVKRAEIQKHSLKYVKQYFLDNNCELLEKEYVDSNTKMRYRCSCGNISEITFSKFRSGRRCKKCANPGYSKESQKLFDSIYDKLNKKQKDRTYYATLNHEFGIRFQNKYFKYDYVNSKSKKAIEYNGSKFHPIPTLKDSAKKWFIYNINKTAKEARNYEKIKYEGLEKRGFQILTVWDYELHKDFDTLVQKCLKFLTA